MKKTYGLICLFFLSVNMLYADGLNLLQAIKEKKVSVTATGNGCYNGECIKVTVKNLTSTKQNIDISPGLIFTCQNTDAQDLMVVEQYMLALMPGASRAQSVYTMCIRQHRYGPAEGELFVLNSEATGHLATLADFIAEKDYQNSTAQSAVWALTDNADINEIYASDTLMAGQLANIISKATGAPRPKIIVPKEHYIYSIRMNMTHHFAKPTKVTLAMYDEEGNVMKEYYKDRLIPVGMYISTFGINRVADKGTKYIFRLTDDKGKILKERIITESVNEPKAEKWRLEVAFEYVLQQPVNGASMRLYDDKGVLMEELFTNRSLPAGGRRQAFNFHHAYGNNTTFYIKLEDSTGKVIVNHKVDGSKSFKVQ